MALHKNIKPTQRHSRLASATLVVLGLMLFMLVTWRDYAEDDSAGTKTKTQSLGLDTPSSVHLSPDVPVVDIAGDTASHPPAASSVGDESARNSLRVQEQISTIRGELSSADASARPTGTAADNHGAIANTAFSPERNFKEILNTSPAVLFIRSSQRDSQYLRSLLLREYEISPQLAVVDLDQHANGDALQRHIRDTKMQQHRGKEHGLPYLFVNGVSAVSNSAQNAVRDAHVDGELIEILRHLAAGKVMFEKVGAPSNN